MSLEKIIAAAIEGDAVEVNNTFSEEISTRIALALEEKYKKAMEAKADDEDEDDEDEDEDDDEDDDDKDDDE